VDPTWAPRVKAVTRGGFSCVVDTGAGDTTTGQREVNHDVEITWIVGGPLQHCNVTNVGGPNITTRTVWTTKTPSIVASWRGGTPQGRAGAFLGGVPSGARRFYEQLLGADAREFTKRTTRLCRN
jgi:hypothetical protein